MPLQALTREPITDAYYETKPVLCRLIDALDPHSESSPTPPLSIEPRRAAVKNISFQISPVVISRLRHELLQGTH